MIQEYKMFNDPYFERARRYVKNEITQEEVDLYSLGKIRKIYGSFEELLFDNLEYYSRIIRTVLWLYENTLVHNGKIITKVEKTCYKIPMTATKFYYITMIQADFKRDEILYGYPQISYAKGQTFQDFWPELLKVGSFVFNLTFSLEHCETKSYQVAFEQDATDNDYLSKVVVNSKFIYIDRLILSHDISNVLKISENIIRNWDLVYKFQEDDTVIDSRPNGISYIGATFSEEVRFLESSISREQIGDVRESLKFDMFLSKKMPDIYDNVQEMKAYRESLDNLKLICISMIQNYRKSFKALRLTPDGNSYSFIVIKKFWNNFRLIECFFNHSRLVWRRSFVFGKIYKVANYLLNNGYFIYTISNLEDCIRVAKLDDPEMILDHFTEYINRTFVDSSYRLELMEKETEKIVNYMKEISILDKEQLNQ